MVVMEKPIGKITFEKEPFLTGVRGRVHRATVHFEDGSQTEAVLKRYREGQALTERQAEANNNAVRRLDEAKVEHLPVQYLKVGIEPGQAVPAREKEGEWIQLTELRMDERGQSILFATHENAKVANEHAGKYLAFVAALANTGLYPSTDAIHTIHPPQSGKFQGRFTVGDFDRLVLAKPELSAKELMRHLDNLDVPENRRWDHAMTLHDALKDEALKNTFRVELLKEKMKMR